MRQRGRAGIAAGLMIAIWGVISSPLHAGTVLVLSQTAAKLTALDTATNEIRNTIDVPKSPSHFSVAPDGTRAFATHSELGQVSVVDLASGKVERIVKVAGAPFGIVVDRNNRIYVGDWNSDQIHLVDPATGSVLRSAAAGNAPAHLSLTPDHRLLVVAAREANLVAIFEAETLEDRTLVDVGRAPFALTTSHDGRIATVANARAGTISQIDLATRRVTKTLRVGAMPYGIAFTHDDAKVLVTNQQSGTVSVLSRDESAATIKVGSYPEGLAISPDSTRAYVANWFSDDVSVIDIETAKEIARIKVPAGPRAVVIVPEGGP